MNNRAAIQLATSASLQHPRAGWGSSAYGWYLLSTCTGMHWPPATAGAAAGQSPFPVCSCWALRATSCPGCPLAFSVCRSCFSLSWAQWLLERERWRLEMRLPSSHFSKWPHLECKAAFCSCFSFFSHRKRAWSFVFWQRGWILPASAPSDSECPP